MAFWIFCEIETVEFEQFVLVQGFPEGYGFLLKFIAAA